MNLLKKLRPIHCIFLSTFCFSAWAAIMEIDQLVLAQGQVIVSNKTQHIQVVDGGVLSELKVKEGDLVKENTLLAVLAPTRADAQVNDLYDQMTNHQIAAIRAQAQSFGKKPNFSKYEKTHPEEVLIQNMLFKKSEDGLESDLSNYRKALKLAQEEYKLSQELYSKGDISLSELMRLERSVIDVNQRMQNVISQYRIDASKELTRLQIEIRSLENRLKERNDIRQQTAITSPTDGVIREIKNFSVGAVYRPGDELLQITPSNQPLIIEAKIQPADVSLVSVGQEVDLNFDAWDFGRYGSLKGKVNYISPDTLAEQGAGGQSYVYYRLRIELNEQQNNQRIPLNHIKTGMTVQANIKADTRSLLTYLTGPVAKSLKASLSEK